MKYSGKIYLGSSNITLNGSDIGVSDEQILQPYTISRINPNTDSNSEEKQIIAQVYADGKQSYTFKAADLSTSAGMSGLWQDESYANVTTYFIETGKETGTYLYRCKITKTEEDKSASIYSIPVSFTLTKKPITVLIKEKSRDFGEENPQLNLVQDIEIPVGALVGDDTIEELGITLTINATSNSPKGVYQITGTSESRNYDVTITNGSLFIMADKPDVMPKDTYTVENTVETLAQAKKILAQQLPVGWVFRESATDAQTILFAGGAGVSTTVEYVAEDKNCYYTTTKQVTITRVAASEGGESPKDNPTAENEESAKHDPAAESGDSVNGYPTLEAAEKKGTAYIYVYAQNGICKKVKISVK